LYVFSFFYCVLEVKDNENILVEAFIFVVVEQNIPTGQYISKISYQINFN